MTGPTRYKAGAARGGRPSCVLAAAAAALCWVLAVAPVSAQSLPSECGSLSTHFGPFDYTTDKSKRAIVESNHFTSSVENLIKGVTGSLGGELSYTLAAFPNHHRALVAISRYGERLKSEKPGQLAYSISCYFQRALVFRPQDMIVRMLYASHLAKAGRLDEAQAQLDVVRAEETDSPFTHYNLGLLYMEIGRHELALAQAHKAMALGMPRTELKDQLVSKGLWREPDNSAAAQAASAPASATGR